MKNEKFGTQQKYQSVFCHAKKQKAATLLFSMGRTSIVLFETK
jgi:hypothetical protein